MEKQTNKEVVKIYNDLKGNKLNVLKTYEIEFTADYKFFSKGDKQKVSEFAFNIYVKTLKVAKEIR